MIEKKSLHFKLVIFEFILFGIITFTIIAIYVKTRNDIYDNNKKYVEDIMVKMSHNITTHFNIIESIMYSTSYNSNVQKFILVKDDLEKVKIFKTVEDHIVQMESLQSELNDIIIIGNSGNCYKLGYDKKRNEQIMDLISGIKPNTKAQFLGVIEIEENYQLVLGNAIYDHANNHIKSEEIGYTIALVQMEIFEQNTIYKEDLDQLVIVK